MSISPPWDAHGQRVQALLLRHEDDIRRVINSRAGPLVLRRTTIDDLFQETVRAALSSAPAFDFVDEGKFMGWATTIVRRVISKTVSGQLGLPNVTRIKRAASSGDGVAQDGIPGFERTPSSVVARGEGSDVLRRAVAALGDDQREVIELYGLQELPLEEVACRMNRSKGAVCQLLARALQQVRQHMGTRNDGRGP